MSLAEPSPCTAKTFGLAFHTAPTLHSLPTPIHTSLLCLPVLFLTCLPAEKFSPEFLEDRRPRLQRFLRTVALHPEMGQGDGVLSRWVLGTESGATSTRAVGPAPPRNSQRLGLKLPGIPGIPGLPGLGRRDESTS